VGFEYSLPVLIDDSFIIGEIVIDAQRILIAVATGFLVAGLWVFTHHTRLGLAFRGIAQDERTALTLGIESDRIAMFSVALGCGLAALAATLIIPLGSISPSDGYEVLIKALAVCIIGGLGSTGGVIAASVVIGFAERFTDTYVSSHWTMIISLAAILIVLAVKPSGLFGRQKELEERI
jgi:branched-chain amino acid transport system permease protein